MRPAVAASLNRDLARIQKWCNHWCMTLNHSKTTALWLVDPGLWTLPMVTWSCLGFPFALVPTSTFWQQLSSPSKTMCVVLSLVSLKELVFWGWCGVSLWTPLLNPTNLFLCCYWCFMWGSAAECHLQFLERQLYSVARLCPDQRFLSLCHRCNVAAQCMLYKVNSDLNHCLFSELPSASVRVRLTWAAAAAHPLKFEVSRCRKSQFARCSLPA